MKKYLINPNLKWCKANLHCHTTNSDGSFTPEEIKQVYLQHGYQIVAFTDHELLFDVSYLTDDNFIAITSTEYSINDFAVPANSTYVNSGSNVIWRDMKTMHISLFSKNPHNTFHPGASLDNFNENHKEKYKGKEIKCDGYYRHFEQESIQETIDRANKAGFLVQLNHPNWSLLKRDDYINLKGLWALEVLNYLTELETGTEYCINVYDDMLREGHILNCTMGDDNHNYNHSLEGSFGGFNYIGVESLNYDNVLNAMENGNIYCSSGPIIKSIVFDSESNKIIVDCSNAINVTLTGYNRTFYHCFGEDITHAEFELNGSEVYFRISVKDKYGGVAHTHAYFLKDIFNI